jgi:hypothetical protein
VKEREVVLDGWEARFGGVRLLVGVSQTDANRPVILERESSGELTRYFFREFNVTTPPVRRKGPGAGVFVSFFPSFHLARRGVMMWCGNLLPAGQLLQRPL